MKDENEDWSEGQMESAAIYTPVNETDCISWDTEGADSEWSEGQFESAAVPFSTNAGDFVEAGPATGISNDAELAVKRTRISEVLDRLTQLRSNGPLDEFARMTGEARAEVERLQAEVLDYLTRRRTITPGQKE